jgi:squalene-hopene/tetraprenyl-beta-curcumene cyclase
MVDLDGAIERSTTAVYDTQLDSGAWDARSDVGPVSTANVLVTFDHLGVLTEDERQRGLAWLRAAQRPDGSFAAYPFAREGGLSVTAQCWAALSLGHDDASRDACARARRFVEARGGPEAVRSLMKTGDVGAIYLALAGLLSADRLPAPPLIWSLFDPAVRFMADRVHFGIVMGSLQLGLIARELQGKLAHRNILERHECARAIELLRLFQNPDGSWNGNTVQTATAMLGLFAAGVKPHEDALAKAIAWTRSRAVNDALGTYYDVFSTDVWTTAFHLRALLLSGASRRELRVVRALSWLASHQLEVPQPWPNQRTPRAVRVGGWPFQTGNVTMADTDDTGIVLSTLKLALMPGDDGHVLDPAIAADLQRRSERAIGFLRAMQNEDGGWGAFVHDLPGHRRAGPLYGEPLDVPPDQPLRAMLALLDAPPELGDPSTEDLVGRVLHGLGSAGLTVGDPMIDRALSFLTRMQTSEGSWWARWLTNYLPGTAYAVTGALAAGAGGEVWRHGIRYLNGRQNLDGGWGESPDSYRDPAQSGRGESSAPMTGLVCAALIEAGAHSSAIPSAIDHLLAAQLPDGTWDNGTYVVTNIPPSDFYTYEGARLHLPLEALARHRSTRA